MILAIPAIKMLKTKFPKAKISILTGGWTKPIVEKIAEIEEILTFDFFFEESEKGKRNLEAQEMDQLQNILHSRNFDLAIDLRRHPETRGILKLSGARHTVGYCTGKDDEGLTICIKPCKEMNDIPSQVPKPHISTELCKLVQAIPTDTRTISPSMQDCEVSFHTEKNLLRNNSRIPKVRFLVGIHPGVGNPLKQWPIFYFARLADLLIERYSAHVLLLGGKKEEKVISQIWSQMKYNDRVDSLAGNTSLEEFINLVRYCHLFIGNDSGPCHIAGVLKVPTLTIFGGQVSPYEWHPLGQKTISVRVDVPCAPCYKALPKDCPYDMKCLKFLWPEKVLEAIQQLLVIN
jgi:lipopolysaccharide heptosyltransferase II